MAIVSPVRYPNTHDARMRLNGTIIKYKGMPVQVVEVVHKSSITLRDLLTNTLILDIHSSDKELDISSPSIGWVQGPSPVYLTRSSARRYKQGLALDSTRVLKGDTGTTRNGLGDLPQTAIGQSILGIFTLGLADLPHNKNGVVLTRQLAVTAIKDLAGVTTTPDFFLLYHYYDVIGVLSVKRKEILAINDRYTKTLAKELKPHLGDYHVKVFTNPA